MHTVHKNLLISGAAAFALLLGAQGPAMAQGQSQPPSAAPVEPSRSPTGQQSPGQNPASEAAQKSKQAEQQMDRLAAQGDKLVGKTVIGANKEEVGDISDVVMGKDGKLSAVLIDVGGFLGIGSKTIAIPSEQLRAEGDQIVASGLSKDVAESMPEYKEQKPQKKQQNKGGQ